MTGTRRLTNLTTGGPVHVDVEDGRIVRIIPLQLDDSDGPTFTIHARGRDFTPPARTTLSPWTVAHRSTIYAPNRILTPLKRVDFDPHGERNIDKRGESGYEPISWDEALDMVADEIIRLKREVGPAAVLTTPGSHHMWGNIGYRFSAYNRFMNLIGYTYAEHNPDSWEGWQWGGAHMWGFSNRLGIPEQYDLLEDALKHSEMVVFWSADPETTGGVYGSFESTVRRDWLKQSGMKMIFIDPYYNHTAGLIGDKWFAPRLGTDVAMGLAIAFVWLTEGLYDKEYVATRTHGFDEWKAYVLGESDGMPKTPDWAEIETTIPAREIRALAREWGAKKTMLAAGGMGGWGGACRAATGNEWTRTMIALAAMQGLGKPGSNIWSTTSGAPFDRSFWFPGYAEGGISGDIAGTAAGIRLAHRMWPDGGTFSNPHHSPEGQIVSRLRIPEAMRHESMEWRAKGFCGGSIESQFTKYRYPASGYPHVQMYYRYGGSFIGTMTDTNRYVQAYRDGKVGFVVNQSIWFEGEARFADIILPACTNFERWDIGDWAYASGYGANKFDQCNHRTIVFQQKCIEPLGRIQARLRDLRRPGRPPRRGRHLHRRRPHRPRLGQADVPRQRPLQAHLVGRVRGEGLLRRAGARGDPLHAGAALVRRGPGQRHSRRFARLGHRQEEGAPDFFRQDRVRLQQPHPLLPDRRDRPGATGHGSAVHPQLGRPPDDRALREVSTPDGLAPRPLQLPHHGRREGLLEQRHQGPPGPQGERPLLLDHAPQLERRDHQEHRGRRPHPRLQRPGGGDPRGPGDRAGATGYRTLLRVVRRLPARGRAGVLGRYRRVRKHANVASIHHPDLDRPGAQLLPY